MALTTVTGSLVSVNAIQGTLIADNAITAVHIATNAVSGTLIADNAVTAVHIAQNTITVTQLADDCVESDKIADGIITTNHLNKAMISSQTEVTAASGDFVLLGDTSDSNNLKKTPVSSIIGLASGTTINNNADNRVITGSGTANTLEGEANLRFDGTNLVLDAAGASVSADDVFGAINFFDQDGGSSAAGVTSSIKSIAVGGVGASKLTFSNSTSGGGARSSLTEKMVIDESGRVGIGTDDPSSGYGGAITAAKVAILSGLSGNNGGSSTLLIGGDNKHYAYMQGTHTSGGSTELDLGTASGANNPTVKMRIHSSGVASFNNGIELGSGVDATAANILDDYEEGTWTPAFYTYSGVTTSSITITLATYTKIGNICHIHANITCTLSSLPGQTVTITGLPFAASGSDQYGIIAIGGHTSNTGANTPKAHFRTNGSQLDGIAYNASSNTAYWTYSSMDAQPFEMSIHGFYTTT